VLFVTRIVLLHGSVMNGRRAWLRQGALTDAFDVAVLNRPGFHGGPAANRIDFDGDAAWLPGVVGDGDHLVAHSYGGIGALLAAPSLPLASLTLVEPPAFHVARGHAAVRAWIDAARELPRDDPLTYARAFLAHVGAPVALAEPLPPDLRHDIDAFFTERWPDEAAIEPSPLAYPVLVVTGDHEPAFEAVGDVLERGLAAQRVVLPGAGHAVQNAAGFNEAVERFVRAA
jgi:hypothetical protein